MNSENTQKNPEDVDWECKPKLENENSVVQILPAGWARMIWFLQVVFQNQTSCECVCVQHFLLVKCSAWKECWNRSVLPCHLACHWKKNVLLAEPKTWNDTSVNMFQSALHDEFWVELYQETTYKLYTIILINRERNLESLQISPWFRPCQMDPPSLGKSHYFLCFGANFWDLVGSILGGAHPREIWYWESCHNSKPWESMLRGMIFFNTNLERERGAEPASRREPSLWSQQKGEARSDMWA
jgi:hypothetical protein